MPQPEQTSYHGNPNLKPLAYQHDFTKEEIKEYVKCKEDPVYFIENYVKLNKDQKSSDLIVSDLVKSSFRKIIKNSIQKKPEIEVHLIRS